MDYNEEIIKILKEQKELLEKILKVFSKYDEEFQQSSDYLINLDKEGFTPPHG